MPPKTRQALAAFTISIILILALAGFLAVDLTAGRDLRGEYEPLFRFSGITPDGMEISLFGERYFFLPHLLAPIKEAAWKLRGLLPESTQAAAILFAHLPASGLAIYPQMYYT
jgi:hypothetical protein